MKKITYKSISSALTDKQLKNILGGSGGGGSQSLCTNPDAPYWVRCNNDTAGCTSNCEWACQDRGGVKDDTCWS